MDTELYKNAIKDAIASEIEAKEFYLEISKRIRDDYLKELFLGFSKEEATHEKILNALLEKGQIKTTTFNETRDFKVAETIALPKVSADMDLKDAIGLAMKNEEIAMQKYETLATNCDDPELQAVFKSLSAMERDHKFKMEESFVKVAYPEVW
jgi:erythrin-vacuolar iron transport family protein